MRIPSPFASAWFRYLAIIFGLLRYLAASKARALRTAQLLYSYFPFAFSPSSTSRPLFRWLFRLVMACTDRFSFRAIDGLSRPDASNVKSCASSAGVHGRPVGRGPSFIWLSPQPQALQAVGSNQPWRRLAIFLNGSLSVFALRRIAKVVRFRASAIVSTLFAFRTSARSFLSCSAVQGARGATVISPLPSAARPPMRTRIPA